MGVVLFILAYILLLPMTIINCFVVWKKGYFMDTAVSIDIFANREYRASWNKWLIVESGYKFGVHGETISSALGKNQELGTLTNTGMGLVYILDFIQKDHCLKSIDYSL